MRLNIILIILTITSGRIRKYYKIVWGGEEFRQGVILRYVCFYENIKGTSTLRSQRRGGEDRTVLGSLLKETKPGTV